MIIDQLFTPKPLQEGGPYDLPGKDYDRPGDTSRKPRPQGSTSPRRHDDDPDFMDPDQRRIRADQARVKKAQDEYHAKKKSGMAEGSAQQLGIQQLATISDEALDKAYGYGRSSPGNTFGWQANLKSAAYAKQMIDKGVTDIEAISDAIHKGWNVTARAFVNNPEQFDDTAKLQSAGKLEAKLQQRAKLMNVEYAQLPDDEQEKDRVVARALLQAIKGGQQDMAEGKRNKQRQLNEALLMEDPLYRRFKRVGRFIAEQKLTEPEILQIFSDAEAGMTDRATGANRTFLGRGKDVTVDFAKDVAGALKGVWSGIQSSVPVAAVDVAYDQATDALANLTGGQKGAVMTAINKYRNLAKQYPKTAGLAKAALVGIAGLATGGAGLPAVAALVYGLDSAIKGEKFSDIVLKAGGAAATAWAGQAIHGGATQPSTGGPADTNAFTNVNQMGDHTGEYVDMPDGSDAVSPLVDPTPDLATYTVQADDNLSKIADRFNTSVAELKGLNPQLAAASGATGGQGMNVDVIFPGQQITLPPGTPGADVYAGGVGTNANTMADIAQGQVPNSAITQGMAARNAVKESIKYRARILPADRLIDQKATVLNWALSESVGRKSKSVNLTTIGTYTVFENIDRYRLALLEATQPGRPDLPDQYAPAMSGGAGVPSKPGLIGRGLNYLDRGVKKVGGALSNFGHQFTTNVTKEKLKMNWHQAGKPSDSDQLAAWLVGQGVPQPVVTSVFGKMGIPYTAPAAEPTAQPAAPVGQTTAPAVGGAQRTSNSGSINPATGREYTGDEIRAKHGFTDPAPTTAPADTEQPAAPATTAPAVASAGGKFPGEDPQGPGYVGRREAARRQAARASQANTAPAKPNFAQQGGGYKSVNYAPNIKTGVSLPKSTAPATPTKTPTQAEKDAYVRSIGAPAMAETRIATALKRPVAEMLRMVETKEDVQRIKQFVDDTFVRYGAVNESAFAMRNQIIEHVTQVGAQRRREHSQRVAH